MNIPVVWKSYHDSPDRGYWDQTFLDWLFAQSPPSGITFTHHIAEYPDAEGAVVVTPGHYRNTDYLEDDIRKYAWVLLIVTSNEEGDFPFWGPKHPNMVIWKHTPLQELPYQPDRPLMLGWTPDTVEHNQSRPDKTLDWVFAGQDGPEGNYRRKHAIQVMRTMRNGQLLATPGFLQGLDRDGYFDLLRSAKVVPCPSGPNIPDTFRLYEALESGAVPVADATCPRGDRGYWQRVFPTPPVFPVIDDWQTLPAVVDEWTDQFRRVQVLAWWEQAKRDMVWRLHEDLIRLGALEAEADVADRVTVLMPTSPIPSHPDTAIIEETMRSVRERLPNAEVIVMADGVRPELEHRREAYVEYLERLVWLCRQWKAIPVVQTEHRHQANMTRQALTMVKTEAVLFVEHDTPLVGDIPVGRMTQLVLSEYFHVVRFHHETRIPKEHEWLMRGVDASHPVGDRPGRLRFARTVQWSQRPHLARTSKYREWIERYFPVTANTMIEDRMHGVVERSNWDEFKIGIWLPDGSIQRSVHLDGRGSDSKFEEAFTW